MFLQIFIKPFTPIVNLIKVPFTTQIGLLYNRYDLTASFQITYLQRHRASNGTRAFSLLTFAKLDRRALGFNFDSRSYHRVFYDEIFLFRMYCTVLRYTAQIHFKASLELGAHLLFWIVVDWHVSYDNFNKLWNRYFAFISYQQFCHGAICIIYFF